MFTKGQTAFLITVANYNGKFAVRPVVVGSCGKKQMTLIHAETGEFLGRNFQPSSVQSKWSEVRADLTAEQALEYAVERSKAFIEYEIGLKEANIARHDGDTSYVAAMRRGIENLKAQTPQSEMR